jgi:hypothetical protein
VQPFEATSVLSKLNPALIALSEEEQLCGVVIYACELVASLYSWAKESNDVIFTLTQLSDVTPKARLTGTAFNCRFDFGWLFYALEKLIGPLEKFVQKMADPQTQYRPIDNPCPKRLLWAILNALSKAWDLMPSQFQNLTGMLAWHLLEHGEENYWSEMGAKVTGKRFKTVALPWNDLEKVLNAVSAFSHVIPAKPLTDLENLAKRWIPDHVSMVHQMALDELASLLQCARGSKPSISTRSYSLAIALRVASILEAISLLILQTLKAHPTTLPWFKDSWLPRLEEIQNHPVFIEPPSPRKNTPISDSNPLGEGYYRGYYAIRSAMDHLMAILTAGPQSPTRSTGSF